MSITFSFHLLGQNNLSTVSLLARMCELTATLCCLLFSESHRESTVGSDCFVHGSSRTRRPRLSASPSGLGTCALNRNIQKLKIGHSCTVQIWKLSLTLRNASMSPTAGMKSGIKGFSLWSSSIVCGVYLKYTLMWLIPVKIHETSISQKSLFSFFVQEVDGGGGLYFFFLEYFHIFHHQLNISWKKWQNCIHC